MQSREPHRDVGAADDHAGARRQVVRASPVGPEDADAVGARQHLDRDGGLGSDDEVVTYCRIGERSSHTWFALKHLLGVDNVRNYDGSWTEWGNTVRVPIVAGEQPGAIPG